MNGWNAPIATTDRFEDSSENQERPASRTRAFLFACNLPDQNGKMMS
jgi:hypothetical protein